MASVAASHAVGIRKRAGSFVQSEENFKDAVFARRKEACAKRAHLGNQALLERELGNPVIESVTLYQYKSCNRKPPWPFRICSQGMKSMRCCNGVDDGASPKPEVDSTPGAVKKL